MKIFLVVGTRPNFIKAAPIIRAFKKMNIEYELVHTGQHHHYNMSQAFFEELGIPEPDVNFDMKSTTYASSGLMMSLFEEYCMWKRPDMVVVVGDVDSTFACAFVAARKGIKIAHVEAGLRSFDRTMPEEINRILTDSITNLFFTTEESAKRNLINEGIIYNKIYFVGNVMIDSLEYGLDREKGFSQISEITKEKYGLVTVHRPSNVDNKQILESILDSLYNISKNIRLIFPLHPRTERNCNVLGLLPKIDRLDNVSIFPPIGYFAMLGLMKQAEFVITDSGGVQEETTYLGIPCLTIRENTERPVTVNMGTNILVGRDMRMLEDNIRKILSGKIKKGRIPPLWDGHAAERIVNILKKEFTHGCE